LIFTGRRKYHR